ncbi:MAG: serine/threonine-protein kinase, partial [Stackebrandtia sp.]
LTLDEVIRGAGPLPEAAALRLAAGLASALSVIHRAELVHRDLKPTNILLTEDGPRVIDFGIARATDNPGGAGLTRTGRVLGTAGYMSPEQAEGREATPASDVFCLGTVLAMACTGSGPFDGPSDPQTLYNIVHTDPDLTAVPARVRRLVERCLAKNPGDRPGPEQLLSSIGELAPSGQPWPVPVHQLIDRRRGEIATLYGKPDPNAVVAGLIDKTRQFTRKLTRVDGSGPDSPARPSILVKAKGAVVRKLGTPSQGSGESNRSLGIVRDVLLVVAGVAIGLFVFADLNIGDVIASDRESLGIGGGELENALTHSGYFGIVIGFQLGGVIGGLTRWIVGKRARVFGRAAVAVAAATGFGLGWLSEHDYLDLGLISLGVNTESWPTEEVAGLLALGVALSLGLLLWASWVAGRVGIVLAVIGLIPSILVGAAWANLSVTGILVGDSLRIGLATVVGGTIGGAVAYRAIAAVRAKKAKPPARQW